MFMGFVAALANQVYALVFELLGSLLSSLRLLVTQFFYRILTTKVQADSNNVPFICDDLSAFLKEVLKKLVFVELG